METPRTILIAEDDIISQQILRTFLAEEGYALDFVEEGTLVLPTARRSKPELILLDVMLPGVDGFTLCQQLRSDPQLGDVPIIMLTSLDDDDSRIKAIELGADEFLTKPVNEAELKARVRTITQLYKFRRLLAQRSNFETLIELAPDGIVIVDEASNIRVANQAFRRMLGGQAGQSLIGRSVIGLVSRGKREAFAKELAPLTRKDAEPVFLETQFEPPGAEPFSAEITAGYFEWDTAPSVEILVRDVTEKKRLHSQFLRMQRLQSVGTLAGGIAHDLKNSLTPIVLAVHMARELVKEGPALRYIDTIERSAARSTDIIKQILAFARGAEGEKRLLQPQYVVRELDKILSQTLPQNIQVISDLPEEDWMVSGDATQLHQVLMNLCVNARDAMPGGGTLTIKIENMTLDPSMAQRLHADARAGAYVCMSVADSGTGIPPEVMEKLFEPFMTTKEVGKGTGLGLSSSLGIVRSHGGFILVETAVGKGTTFSVYIPAAKENLSEIGTSRVEKPPQGRGQTLLVVDDEKDIREMIGETLQKYGYKVLVAKEGPEAVALFARHAQEVRLALVDFRMPVLDGVCTIRALRYLQAGAPAILMSEVEEKDELMLASDGLKIPRLVKPFSVESLLRKVAESLPV